MNAKKVLAPPRPAISEEEIESYRDKLSDLSNRARYAQAYALARSLTRKYPQVISFAYYEAVFSAEDDINFTPSQVRSRHRAAAAKFRVLLKRLRGVSPQRRASFRNEYYWFSHQPYKQYALGVREVRAGRKRAYYSQGVGAVELAKVYARQGKAALALRWARRSELAWLRFFKVDSEWSNAYGFFALALGLQGRVDEMEAALAKMAKLAEKSPRWKAMQMVRDDCADTLAAWARARMKRGG